MDKSYVVLRGVLYFTDTGLREKEKSIVRLILDKTSTRMKSLGMRGSTMTCTPQTVDIPRKADVLIVPGCWHWRGVW
ncbi:hypothetical protein C5167_030614 [Papaver somniferum]|nr:hypothetical protein C5167_030614 [Papaver somniferum]